MSSRRRKSTVPVRHTTDSVRGDRHSQHTDSYICGLCQVDFQSLWSFLAHKRLCELSRNPVPKLQDLARQTLINNGLHFGPPTTPRSEAQAAAVAEVTQSSALEQPSNSSPRSPGALSSINLALMTVQQQHLMQLQLLQRIYAQNQMISRTLGVQPRNASIAHGETEQPAKQAPNPSKSVEPVTPGEDLSSPHSSSVQQDPPRARSLPIRPKPEIPEYADPELRSSKSDTGNFPGTLSNASSMEDLKSIGSEMVVTAPNDSTNQASAKVLSQNQPGSLHLLPPSGNHLADFLQSVWASRVSSQQPFVPSLPGVEPPSFGSHPGSKPDRPDPPERSMPADEDWEQMMEVTVTNEADKLSRLVDQLDPSRRVTDPNQCIICKRVLSCKSALQMHYRTHTGERPFKCKICLRAFTTKGNLKTHMGVHRIKAPMKFFHSCPVCQRKFTNAVLLEQHMRSHNGVAPGMTHLPRPIWSQDSHNGPLSIFNRSSVSTSSGLDGPPPKKALTQSLSVNSEDSRSGISEKSLPVSSLPIPMGNPFDKVMFPSPNPSVGSNGRSNTTCNVCFKTFACNSALDIHYRSHTKERPFKCTKCGRGFTTKGNMKQHLLTHKDGRDSLSREEPQALPASMPDGQGNSSICSDENSQEGRETPATDLSRHNTSRQLFVSPDSGSELADTDPLREIEKMWKSASQESNEPNSVRRPRPNLSKHQCHVCFKHFSSASALQIHMRTHTGDKPFKCDVCERAFTTKGNLKVHMGTHVWSPNSVARRGRKVNDQGLPDSGPNTPGPQLGPQLPGLFNLPGPLGFPTSLHFPFPRGDLPHPHQIPLKIDPSQTDRTRGGDEQKNGENRADKSGEEPSPVEESPTASTPAAMFSPFAFDAPFRPPFLPNFLSPMVSTAAAGFPPFFRFAAPGQGLLAGYPFNLPHLVNRPMTSDIGPPRVDS